MGADGENAACVADAVCPVDEIAVGGNTDFRTEVRSAESWRHLGIICCGERAHVEGLKPRRAGPWTAICCDIESLRAVPSNRRARGIQVTLRYCFCSIA